MRFCTNCGKPLTDDAVFCTNCGQKAMTPKSAPAGPGTPGVVPPVPNGPAPVPPTVSRPNPVPPVQNRPYSVPPVPNRPGYVPPAGHAPMNPLPPKKENEPKQKKSPLVPILIVSAVLLTALVAVLCVFIFGKKPDSPDDETRRADQRTEEPTRRPDKETTKADPSERTTAPSTSSKAPESSATEPSKTKEPSTEPTETDPPETTEEDRFNPEFLGEWYGDQKSVFILYEDGTVDYYDGGVDGNKLKGEWTLDESTGRFEMDLFGGSNRFYLYSDLSRGSDSTIMYRMAMDWSKSTTTLWYYETFYRERPSKYLTDDEKVKQPYP